jgi:hypothetical protein
MHGWPERVGSATAWRLGQAAEAAHAWDGAVTEGPVVARLRQGVVGELEGTTGRAPGKEGAGGAHRGGDTTTGRRGGSVRWRAAGSSPKEGRR